MTQFYKMTNPDRRTQGDYQWPEVGEWAEVGKRAKAPLKASDLCTSRVLHVTDFDHLLDWAKDELYEVEVDESRGIVVGDNKTGVRRARLTKRVEAWNDLTLRLFAADCAEHVLPLFEQRYPDDKRPREAIEVARRFARGEATREELAAARAAAWAARAAAWAAARAAAWAAARAAAGAAETTWQRALLREYLGLPKDGAKK